MVCAAEELIKRGWQWHKVDRKWMRPKDDVKAASQQGSQGHKGTFEYFDVAEWAFKERKGFFFDVKCVEAAPRSAPNGCSSGLQGQASR
jgi:CCR4-NOT transcriptional regulation complex NOT5 subunit